MEVVVSPVNLAFTVRERLKTQRSQRLMVLLEFIVSEQISTVNLGQQCP